MRVAPPALSRVLLVSLEPWDQTWRRNQHLASRLVRHGHVSEVVFAGPPRRTVTPPWSPEAGILVVQPQLRLPKRVGGLALAAQTLRGSARDSDVLWVNDVTVGVHLLRLGVPAVYDVTDDWRFLAQSERSHARWVAAEDRVVAGSRTVVCSAELGRRWQQRYGVDSPIVQNGVDIGAIRSARVDAHPLLPGPGPHLGYVGTLHDDRLDVTLVERLAEKSTGTVHLVGPDALDPASRERLLASGVQFHGAIPSADVPTWLTGMDVLLCPHVVTDFTLSLDAIKSHEYLATGKPVVATPTSGFQALHAPGVHVVPADEFIAATEDAASRAADYGTRGAVDWDVRTAAFAAQLIAVGVDR